MAPRFPRLTRRRLVAAGLLASAVGATEFVRAQPPSAGPAARLMPPKPLDPPAAVVGRGSAPDFSAVAPPARPTGGWLNGPGGAPPPRQPVTTAAPAKRPSLVESAWGDVKDLVSGPTTSRPPLVPLDPSGGRYPVAASPPPVGGSLAGAPAYRWYGWGTTSPGANPLAPTGQYPTASGNWYAQSGATPGAFPVPVVHPFRPPPGIDTPVYVAAPLPPPAIGPVVHMPRPVPVSEPPARATPPTIPVPPGPSPSGPLVSIPEPEPEPIAQTPTSGPAIVPAAATVPAADPGVTWQKAATDGVAFAAVGPRPSPPTTADLIRKAVGARATVTDVRATGPGKMTVHLTAATDADARAAYDAVSKLPELAKYEVVFEAKVGQK